MRVGTVCRCMGTHTVHPVDHGEGDRNAMRRVLRDLDAFERMLAGGLFETDRKRIGVEQELVLVDEGMQPASLAMEVLQLVGDPRVVPEIARFNIEFNGDPVELGSDCLAALQSQVESLYGAVDSACRSLGARALLSGICPTVDLTHVGTANIMPFDRYRALDEALRGLRGEDYELRIDGADELIVRHPSVMLEAVNASFQVHYQTTPDEFAGAYNAALAVAAPVLAAAVNSPILFGKRLWRETRIPIFQQVVDTRSVGVGHREFLGRVRFGESWVKASVLEVLRADVSRFRQILLAGGEQPEDPIAELDAGRVPRLEAWQAFNSSVYRWMRPCYGVTGGRPHLRIENRVLPSGPTISDEIANAAFWIGLMNEGPSRWPDVHERLELSDARENFLRAARDGLTAHMRWLDGHHQPIGELILGEFLPAAASGLERAGVSARDASRALGIIEQRVASRRTGAEWVLRAAARLRGVGSRGSRLARITRAMLERQDTGQPVHEWEDLEIPESASRADEFARVSQCMTTDLFTVAEHDGIDLVASIMDWEHVRHIPVEDATHRLVGLVSYRKLLRAIGRGQIGGNGPTVRVADIMEREPITVTPDTPTLDAIRLMCDRNISCLPVVEDGRLVGILSDRDYTEVARVLLEGALRGEGGS